MFIYVLHFEVPRHHARHYLGSTNDVPHRLHQHANGTGARLTQVLAEDCEEWTLAALYQVSDRNIERLIKNQHNGPRWCLTCRPNFQPPRWATPINLNTCQFPLTSQEYRNV